MIPIYQIHPMIVHFPIVLFVLVFLLSVSVVARGGNLAERATLPTTTLTLLWLGVLLAMTAAVFGGIAAGHASSVGFSDEPIGVHAGYARMTVLTFIVLAIALSVFRWRNISMAGARGWIFTLFVLAGVGLIVTTAYFGGHLVYDLGVNVNGVHPQ